jgi:hypothetical protein
MHDMGSTAFVLITSVGIFLYIYNARRKHSQMIARYNRKLIKADQPEDLFTGYTWQPITRETLEADELSGNSDYISSSITLWEDGTDDPVQNKAIGGLLKSDINPCYKRSS